MKRIYLAIIAIMLAASAIAQNVDYWCVDGRVYFKINDDVALNISNDDGNVNPKDVFFLRDMIDEYQISNLDMPFLSAESDILQRIFRMDFDKMYKVEQLVKDMNNMPEIEYAEKAPLFRISMVPNDPYYGEVSGSYSAAANWHLTNINAEAAWDITTGDTNIVVAVLDNAIYVNHPDLQNKIVEQVDLGNGDNDPSPPENTYIWSHGTHGAGLIAAETNNGVGVASIGYDVSIMAVKLGDDASDGQAMAAGFEGIVWAADHGADVINMSWGSPQFFITMQHTVNYAYNKGCVLVGAAGNNGNGAETQMNPDIPVNYVGYPAALEHVIAVGSNDVGDNKSDFSNYGTWIDVLAPGGYYNEGFLGIGRFSVLSTTASEAGDIVSSLSGEGGGAADYGVTGQYDIMQGTSMAAPVTSGLCGLMLSANPDLTPEELTAILKSTCDNVDAENTAFIDSIGSGRINAASAVQACLNSVAPLVANFEASEVVIAVDGTVDFTDLTTGTPTSWSWTFEGGMPATSTDQNPTAITYDTEGVYQVTLEASDGTNTDTEIKTTFIIVGTSGGAESAWIEQNTLFANQFRGVIQTAIADENTAWVITYDGTGGSITSDFSRTADGGETWIPDTIEAPTELAPGCITATDDLNAWVALYNTSGGGGIYHTSDGGENWAEQPTAAFDNAASFPNVVHMFNANDGFCQGDPINEEFEIYTTSDGGNTWSLVDGANIPDPVTDEMGWTGVYDAVGDVAWFGTNNGRIFKTTDKGATWTVMESGEDNISRISMSDEDNGVLIAQVTNQSTGQIESWAMRNTTDGENWSTITIPEEEQPSDVSAVPGTPGIFISVKISQTTEENFSAYSLDYGTTWNQLDDSIQYTNVQMFDANTGWAGSFNLSETSGGIYKWAGIQQGDDPYFTSSPVTEIIEGETYTYNINAIDPNALPLTLSQTAMPTWLSLTGNVLSGTAPIISGETEDFNVELVASNGTEEGYQNFTITVLTSNQAPEITSEAVTNATVGEVYTYNVTAEDADDDNLTFTLVDAPEWMTMTGNEDGDGNIALTGTPDVTSTFGLPVKVKVSDGMYDDQQNYSLIIAEGDYIINFGGGDVSVYPNPSSNYLMIENCQEVKYEIVSIDGKVLNQGIIENQIQKINLNTLSNGMYLLKLTKADQRASVAVQIIK
ncbi:MAG: S8 family serine peptidase [Bacteroidota bacterium]|nr:S8 family serine peptidase [Bacteroidota bacterium]